MMSLARMIRIHPDTHPKKISYPKGSGLHDGLCWGTPAISAAQETSRMTAARI